MSVATSPVRLPHYFGASPQADVFFQPCTKSSQAIRTQVALAHHLISLVQESAG
jgi:hypothetical protein